jgi:hypothetical protein
VLGLSTLLSSCVGRETEVGPVGHSAKLRVGVRSTFSQEQCIYPTMLMTHERLLYADHVIYVWSGAIRGLSVECVWRVD